MYSFNSKVRYSEVDCNSQLRISSIIDYFQDCNCFHSEALGVGVEYAKEKGCAWLLNTWQIVVPQFPKYLDEIQISTWAYDFDSLYGYRNHTMRDSSGKLLAMANSRWIYVNIDAAKPVRLTSEIIDIYPLEPKLDEIQYLGRKLSLPEEYTEHDPIVVQPYQIDTNHHVNNGQYIQIVQNFIPNDFKIWQMRVEYRKQALLGDIMIPRVSISEDVCTVALVNTNGMPYCVVEFSKNPNTIDE